MTEEKILTKHPLGKSGKNITKQNHEALKKAILSAFKRERTYSHRVVPPTQQKPEGQISREHQLVRGDGQTGLGS